MSIEHGGGQVWMWPAAPEGQAPETAPTSLGRFASGTLRIEGPYWHLVWCLDCEHQAPLSFEDSDARGEWMRQHTEGTDHHAYLTSYQPRRTP